MGLRDSERLFKGNGGENIMAKKHDNFSTDNVAGRILMKRIKRVLSLTLVLALMFSISLEGNSLAANAKKKIYAWFHFVYNTAAKPLVLPNTMCKTLCFQEQTFQYLKISLFNVKLNTEE